MEKQLMKIVVSAKSKYGVLDKTTERWFNPSDAKLLKEFIVDGEYDVEMEANKGKDGKTYTNIARIVARQETAKSKVAPSLNKGSQGGSMRDFDKEARGKTTCAAIEAGLQSARVQMLSSEAEIDAWLDHVVAYTLKKVFGA